MEAADPPAVKLTEADLFARICARFKDPEYATLRQVRNGTGWAGDVTADAISICCYPSRGLAVHGFEIKVSRGDWRRELAKPRKAEGIVQFCDHFWIVAPPKVVQLDELPKPWGLLETRGKGLVQRKAAPSLEPEALDRAFVASVLRNAKRSLDSDEEKLARTRAEARGYDRGLKSGKDRAYAELRERLRVAEKVERLEKELGVPLLGWKGKLEALRDAIQVVDDVNAVARIKESVESFKSRLSRQISELGS